MKSRMARWFIALALGVSLASPAYAQLSQGRLAGMVTDTQGAVLPGVTVTVTSPSLIGVQTTVTQADGRYMFPSLPSGTYKVSFDLTGFKKVERTNIARGPKRSTIQHVANPASMTGIVTGATARKNSAKFHSA